MDLSKKVRRLCILKNIKVIIDLMDEDERRERRYWVNPFIEKHEMHSLEAHLLKDVLWSDGNEYVNFCRIDITQFEEILSMVDIKIKKQDTRMRFAITSRTRLAITLRFLASGDSYRSLEYLSRVSRKTISDFVPEVLSAIFEALQNKYLKCPTTEDEWKEVSKQFDHLFVFICTVGSFNEYITRNNVAELDEDSVVSITELTEENYEDTATTPAPVKKAKMTVDKICQKFSETIHNIEKSLVSSTIETTTDEAFMKTVVCLMEDLPVEFKDQFQEKNLQELYRLRRENRNSNYF